MILGLERQFVGQAGVIDFHFFDFQASASRWLAMYFVWISVRRNVIVLYDTSLRCPVSRREERYI